MLPRSDHLPSRGLRPRTVRHARFRRCVSLAAAAMLVVVVAAPVVAVETDLVAERARVCREEWRAAAADPRLETLRALGRCEIDRRLVTLASLTVRVRTSEVVTAEHKTQLISVNDVNPASYEVEQEGLRGLRAEIDAETNLRELRADLGRIGPEFRVYLLVVPRTHLVGAADAAERVVARYGRVEAELEALIEQAAAAGRDVSGAEAALASMVAKVADAAGLVAPIADRLMPLGPADWNDGTAGPMLEAARTAIREARALFRGARADAHRVIELLVG